MPTPITELLSRTIYNTDGTTTIWNFNFAGGYLDKAHVKAYTEAPTGVRTYLTVVPSDVIGPAQLQIIPSPPVGNYLVIYRATPRNLPIVDFTDGSGLSEVSLDINARQAVFLAAESQDAVAAVPLDQAIQAALSAKASADAASASAAISVTSVTASASNASLANGYRVAAGVYAANSLTSSVAADNSAQAAAASALGAASAVAAYAASLAASSGSSLVGYDGGTVQAVMDYSKSFQSYTALRAYTGRAFACTITSQYIYGNFIRDLSDVTSTDDGGLTIIDALGRRWKRAGVSVISVKWWGATGNGVVDDTVAMQAAHNIKRLIHYPDGVYLFTPTVTLESGGICGNGPLNSILKSNDTGTANLFKYVGALDSYTRGSLFHSFSLVTPPNKTNGAGIQVYPPSGEASYLDFKNVHFVYCPLGVDFVAASLWKVTDCDFLAYTVAGVQVANTNSPDSGDSVIANCVFNNPYAIGSGVWQKSSGGLKIIGNKFLGGQRGYTLNLEASTSVLLISGNSFENMADADISLACGVAGTSFLNVSIVGNEFSVGKYAVATDASGFLSEVVVSGNIVNMGATGSNPCIALNQVTDFFVGGNVIKGNGGLGSSGINITDCANGKVGINTYANLPNPVAITNSPTVICELDSQSGSSQTPSTGWTVNGALFQSAVVSVTFPKPFLIAPKVSDIIVSSNSGSGTITGFAIAATTTGFQYVAIHSQTGAIGYINWKAFGIL